MGVRDYNFIVGPETSTLPTATTPSASTDTMTKGYADTTYAQRNAWYDKQASVTAIKGISSSDRFNGQIVFNYGTSVFYKFDSASSATGDDDLVLTPTSGTGRWLKVAGSSSGSGDSLIQQLDNLVASIKAGEAISDRDAVCVDVCMGGTAYRIFKADSDNVTRKFSWAGFAKATASVTPGIYTYTISAAFVASNVIATTINGRNYSTTYSSSSDATLQAVATQIATDPEVQSASVTVVGGNQTGTDDRVITVTAKGGLGLTMSATVTAGVSQPTVTVVQTQAPAGDTVDIHEQGHLSGMTGLTFGLQYYLSTTAGSITASPTDPVPIYVGTATSTTTLKVERTDTRLQYSPPQIFVRSHGGSTAKTAANNKDDVEHYNFTSWTNGTASTTARGKCNGSDAAFNLKQHIVDGVNASDAQTALFKAYDKTSWSTLTNRGTARSGGAVSVLSGFLFVGKGHTGNSFTTNVSTLDKWDGASWTSPGSFAQNSSTIAAFTHTAKIRYIGGNNAAGTDQNYHHTYDGASFSTDTVLGVSRATVGGSLSSGGLGLIGTNEAGPANSQTYTWNGSWSASIALGYIASGEDESNCGPAAAYYAGGNQALLNGGSSATTTSINTTAKYDGTSWSTTTASANSRAGGVGSLV